MAYLRQHATANSTLNHVETFDGSWHQMIFVTLLNAITVCFSYMTVKGALKHIDVAFYTGKLCFVLSQGKYFILCYEVP